MTCGSITTNVNESTKVQNAQRWISPCKFNLLHARRKLALDRRQTDYNNPCACTEHKWWLKLHSWRMSEKIHRARSPWVIHTVYICTPITLSLRFASCTIRHRLSSRNRSSEGQKGKMCTILCSTISSRHDRYTGARHSYNYTEDNSTITN